MGLFQNLLISVIHLLFIAMDIVMTMILLEVIYEKKHYEALKPIVKAATPVIDILVIRLSRLVESVTYKVYSRKKLLILLVLCMLVIRMVICGIF